MEESYSHSESVSPPENAFEHTPLLDDDKQIRLLRIRPSLPFDEPRCSLESFYITALPSYVALSYRWGDVNNKVPFRIGDATFQVPFTAWSALQYIELPAKTYIWIDAICINQVNIDERNAQVALMGTIYSRARSVLIWLGLETSQTALAFEALQCAMRLKVSTLDSRRVERYCSALAQLFDNEYWNRTWIIQEILSASRITITCGRQRVIWDLVAFLLKEVIPAWHNLLVRQHLWHSVAKGLECTTAGVLVTSREAFQQQRSGKSESSSPQLHEFLSHHRHSRCFDPRDKVYALLGLFNSFSGMPLQVDYSLSIPELLVICMAHDLESRRSEQVLLVAGRFQGLLGMTSSDRTLQAWFKQRLGVIDVSFSGTHSQFRLKLDSGLILPLPLAMVSCRATSAVPHLALPEFLSLPAIRIVTYGKLQSLTMSMNLDRVFRDRLVTYLWTHKDALWAAAQDCPDTAMLVKTSRSYTGVDTDQIWEHMEKAYEATNPSVPPESPSSPQLVHANTNNLYILCPSAQPGDVIFHSEDSGHTLQYVLRETSSSWTVIGTAVPIDLTGQDANGEHVDIFLDPLNALIFSNPLRDVVPKFDDVEF